ncbi:MAG: DNA-3-methyladenine glycosylase 2 family protein [Lentisphaerae bacterium]|nr:DNA-3-methyladenine glycosylase 2 family protein [Lentisphaerota bacterium]
MRTVTEKRFRFPEISRFPACNGSRLCYIAPSSVCSSSWFIRESITVMKIFRITEQDKKALCRQAPEFRQIVRQADLKSFICSDDLFLALVQSIVSQQLSVKVADVIFQRVETLLKKITARNLLAADPEALRGCGLSGRKIEYLRGIAEAQLDGTIDFKTLSGKPDAEIIQELVKLKGVGVWTAEMLLIFSLGRPDILSYKDLGIRRGIMMLNGLTDLSEAEFETYRKRYSPYGTLASLYLWRIKDGGLTVKAPAPKSKGKKEK